MSQPVAQNLGEARKPLILAQGSLVQLPQGLNTSASGPAQPRRRQGCKEGEETGLEGSTKLQCSSGRRLRVGNIYGSNKKGKFTQGPFVVFQEKLPSAHKCFQGGMGDTP